MNNEIWEFMLPITGTLIEIDEKAFISEPSKVSGISLK